MPTQDNHSLDDALKKAHQHALQSQGLSDTEKDQLLMAITGKQDVSKKTRLSWWQGFQLGASFAALGCFAILLWQYQSRDLTPVYAVNSYQTMQVIEPTTTGFAAQEHTLTGEESLARISELARLTRQTQAHIQQSHALNRARLIQGKVIQTDSEILIADCNQKVIYAIELELLQAFTRNPWHLVKPGAYVAMTLDDEGKLTLKNTSQSQC